jgi:hypothetical protein
MLRGSTATQVSKTFFQWVLCTSIQYKSVVGYCLGLAAKAPAFGARWCSVRLRSVDQVPIREPTARRAPHFGLWFGCFAELDVPFVGAVIFHPLPDVSRSGQSFAFFALPRRIIRAH